MQVNFPSVTFWYNEGYDVSEIATSHSFLDAFDPVEKELRLLKKVRLLFG